MVEYCAHRAISLLLFFVFHFMFCSACSLSLSLSLTHTHTHIHRVLFAPSSKNCTRDPMPSKPYQPENITAFGGVSIGPKEDKLGIRASSTCPVTFSGCEVPAANVLGEVSLFYFAALFRPW